MKKKYFIQFWGLSFKSADEMSKFIKLLDEIIYPKQLNHYLIDTGIPKPVDNLVELIEEYERKKDALILNTGNESSYCGISFHTAYQSVSPLHFFSATFKITDFSISELLIFEKIKLIANITEVYYIYINHPEQNYDIKSHFYGWGTDDEPPINIGLPIITNKPDPNVKIGTYPVYFAWINYWSKELVYAVEMNYYIDKDLFYKSIELDNGGVLFQLTEEPLNVNNAKHLETLRRCYERFDKIGNQYLLKNT